MYRIVSIVFFICTHFCTSQTTILGKVSDGKNIIFGSSVLLKDSTNNIIDYSFTNESGQYKLETLKKGFHLIEFKSLGYRSKDTSFLIQERKAINIDIILEPQPLDLEEVIVRAELDITTKKDTIVFKANAFAQGNEEVVEDLFRKIPGFTIDLDGTIKVGDQEVEKIMVEGDDLFERGYKILTKNMPAQPIDKIELIQNYSHNRLLKNIEDSERIAINLKLSEDAKRIWFGNASMGYGTFSNDDRYAARGNLMNFGSKNKYYFLSNLNNIGYDATGDVNDLIRPVRFNEPASIGDDQNLLPLITLTASPPNLGRNRTTFNNAELAAINAIFNPTDKVKLKTLGFFNWDEHDFFRDLTEITSVNGLDFTNTENYELSSKRKIGLGKVDLIYDISQTQMLETTSKYKSANYRSPSNLDFNGQSIVENLDYPTELFDQKISYTNNFRKKNVLLLTARFINETVRQKYDINQFLFQDLFPNTISNTVSQYINQEMTFTGIEAHLLKRNRNNNLLELKFGDSYRRDVLISQFSLLEDNTMVNNPTGYQNNTIYSVNDLYIQGKYMFSFYKFTLTGNLAFHQLFNSIVQENQQETEQPFFVNPSLSLNWNINSNNKIRTSFRQSRTNAGILNIYNNYVLTDFRSFTSGANEINQLDSSALSFNYQLGNWSKRFFANTIITYTENHDYFSTNSQVNQNYTLSGTIVIKDRKLFTTNTTLDYFLKKLESNLKLELGYSQSEFKNIVNNSGLREVKSSNYNYGLEFRTAFDGTFNFHLGSKWLTNKIETTSTNEFTNSISFIDLTFSFNDKLNLDLNSERYFFGNSDTDSTYYFLDFDIRYVFKENKLTFMLSGENLLNTNSFRDFTISDIGTSTTEYRLLPRFVLMKMEYRF